MAAADNKAILARFIDEAWNNGNLDVVDELVAPRYVIHHDPGDPWDSRTLDPAAFKQRLVESRAPFPDLCFTVGEIVAEDDRVAVTWRLCGTQSGDLPGFPTSGKKVDLSGMTIYYFTDGKISGHWQEKDRLALLGQLGAPLE